MRNWISAKVFSAQVHYLVNGNDNQSINQSKFIFQVITEKLQFMTIVLATFNVNDNESKNSIQNSSFSAENGQTRL